MKNYVILCLVVFLSTNVFSQRVINEKKDVQLVKYPATSMKGVKTYAIKCNPVEEDLTGDFLKYAPDKYYTNGVLALQGYSYNEETPDVTISLLANPFELPYYIIENISNDRARPDFRAIYKTAHPWEIQIKGKFSADLKLSDYTDSVKVMFPPRYDSYGIPTKPVESAEIIKRTIEQKEEEILDYVIEALYDELMLAAREVVKTQLSYSKTIQEVEVEGFKSNKKYDYSAWNRPFTSGLEILNKLNSGAAPSGLYSEYKSIFDFWDNEIEKGLSDPKEYKKELRVASNNLVNLLLLVNPGAIKDIYLEECSNSFAGRGNTRIHFVADTKARWEAFKISEHTNEEVFTTSPLGKNCYDVIFSDNDGNTHNGIIKLSEVYGKNPVEACNSFNIYKKSVYDENLGQPGSKDKIKEKDISGYSLLGIQYKNMEFKDPTVLSIGKNVAFMEELIKGKASLYKMYEQDLAEGLIIGGEDQGKPVEEKLVISKDGDTQVIFNYTRLAKMLDDKTEVAEKIKNGEYGNEPKKEASSGLAKFIQEGSTNSVSEESLIMIVNDYNL